MIGWKVQPVVVGMEKGWFFMISHFLWFSSQFLSIALNISQLYSTLFGHNWLVWWRCESDWLINTRASFRSSCRYNRHNIFRSFSVFCYFSPAWYMSMLFLCFAFFTRLINFHVFSLHNTFSLVFPVLLNFNGAIHFPCVFFLCFLSPARYISFTGKIHWSHCHFLDKTSHTLPRRQNVYVLIGSIPTVS